MKAKCSITKLTFLSIVIFGMFLTEVAGAQGWYNMSWQYRRPITVANPGGTALTNYQVMISLNSSSFDFSKANSGGSDVRVTDTDGTTLLPFWIEEWNAGTQLARVWVKIPSIPSGGSTAYLYYGNSLAATSSDGTNTFNLFDDTWISSSGNLNPVQVATQPWWEVDASYPMVFEDNSFPDRPRFHMLYDGHHQSGIGNAKGYTTSTDLINWTAYDNGLSGYARINPVMGVAGYAGSAQFAWGDVIKVGSTYHMFPSNAGPGITVHCQSTDLIHWTNQSGGSVTFDALNPSDPSGIGTGVAILKLADGITPVIVDNKYWMIYFHGFSAGNMYMAYTDASGDLLTWTTCYSGSPVLTPSGWEGSGLWTPSFVKVNDKYYIYYQAGSPFKIGFASAPSTSEGTPVRPDNTPWTKSSNNPVITNTHGWDNGFCQDPILRCFDGVYYLFYTGDPPWTNGFATSSNPEGPWIQYGQSVGGSVNWTKTGTPAISDGIISFAAGQAIKSPASYTPGTAVGFRANYGPQGGAENRWGGFISGTGGTTPPDRAIIQKTTYSGTNNNTLYLSTHPTYTELSLLDNQFHVYEVLWRSGRADALLDHGAASNFATSNVPSASLPVTFYNYAGTSPLQVDWVFIRQYSNPEPSSNIGAEQNQCTPNPPGVISPVIYCQGTTALPLTATGSNLLWYTAPAGGTGSPNAPIPSTVIPGTTNFYVSQSVDGCESDRAQIDVIVTGEGLWFDENWQYRRPIVVFNPAGITLTDYQVMISLDNTFDFTKANPDGSDIRVTDADGVTLIPYWIEKWNPNTQEARVWVKIPTIPIGGSTAFLYFGNPDAPSLNDGISTFLLFDDTWEMPGINSNPVQVSSQPWWESQVSYPIVFEDNSFPDRPRFHMLYDGHFVIGHAKGYATSPDLINWTSYDNGLSGNARINPIMGVGYAGGTQFAWGDFIKIGSVYHMLVSSGPVTTVHCQSTDLIHWTNNTGGSTTFDPITSDDPAGIGTGVAILKEADGVTPVVVDGKYWIIYFHGSSGGNMYMAYTDATGDLLTWTRCYGGSPVLIPSGWEGTTLWTPSFTKVNDNYYIYYQGGSPYKIGFAKAPAINGGNPVRPDQTSWTKSPNNPVITNTHGWDNGFCQDPTLRCFDGVYYMFYTGDPPWTNGFAYSDSPEGPWIQYGQSGGGQNIWTKTGNPTVTDGILNLANGQGLNSVYSYMPGRAVGFRANFGSTVSGSRWGGFISGTGGNQGNDRVIIENYPDISILNLSTHPTYSYLTNMDNQFHVYEVLWGQGRADAMLDHGDAVASSTNNVPALNLPLTIRNYNSTSSCQFDWIFVRQYVSPEPLVITGNDQRRIALNLTVFLEGPFNGIEMNTDISDLSLLPLSQPYNVSPWNYPGNETLTDLPNPDVVDWILIELRDAQDAVSATQATRIVRQAALLLNNGKIVGLDGSSPLNFYESVDHHLFVVLWHRNHLGIMSSEFLTESGGINTYDFTIAAEKAYGGTFAQKQIAPGIWGMMGGDGIPDGEINTFDKSPAWEIPAGLQDYFESDYNIDTQIDNKDKNDIWVPNIGSGSQVPD